MNKVLVMGCEWAERSLHVQEIRRELNASTNWQVSHAWGPSSPAGKFPVLNQMLPLVDLKTFAYVIVCDDDVQLPSGFLDSFLALVAKYDFSLAQPARDAGSHIDHGIVAQQRGVISRRTLFVEIGPLFVVRADAYQYIFPFNEVSPMGWGYDFMWPKRLNDAGLKLGIVDAVPVGHPNGSGESYNKFMAGVAMHKLLATEPHLNAEGAFVTLETYK